MGRSIRKDKKPPTDFQVRIGDDELGRIFHLRDSLDQSETLIQHAFNYRQMNWVLEARGEGGANLDFSQSSEVWGERLMTLALAGVELDLGIRTGLPSRLLVLETSSKETLLDSYGEWRSACRALAGEEREQHYFVLPPEAWTPICGYLENFQVRVYGQGGLVLAPPSRGAGSGHLWTWVTPPWERPPDPPGPPVWEFLDDFGLLQEAGESDGTWEVLPWDQVYALIAPHNGIIRTLLRPTVPAASYYRELAHQARKAGINDPELLFSLLWHAPRGDMRDFPDRVAFIRELATNTQEYEGTRPEADRNATPAPQAGSPEPAAADFLPSANGLVEFMENRVVLDRGRYESMIFELAELTAKAEALQRRLDELEQCCKPGQATPPSKAMDVELFHGQACQPNSQFPFDAPVGTPPPGHKRKPLSSLKAEVQEFLKNNTDLARDDESVRMLQFCLRNYIDLNPELHGLPLEEKLEMAGKMAREFMTQVCHRGA